jgi:hypothetical protein
MRILQRVNGREMKTGVGVPDVRNAPAAQGPPWIETGGRGELGKQCRSIVKSDFGATWEILLLVKDARSGCLDHAVYPTPLTAR